MSEPSTAAPALGVQLAERFVMDHVTIAAAALEENAPAAVADYLGGLPPVAAGSLLQSMLPEQAALVVAQLPAETIQRVLPRISAPRAATLLGWLDPTTQDRILQPVGKRLARELRDLAAYPPNTAGALMDPRVIAVRETESARDVLERLREAPRTLHQIHVVDAEQRLIGVLPIQELALLEQQAPIGPHVHRTANAVAVMANREEIVALLERTGEPTVAVVDSEGVLVGVLRHRALVSAVEAEALGDLQKMVGASRDEGALSPVGFAVRKRLPWLQINLLTAFLAAAVVGLFESTIAKVTSLAVLLPVVAGQSGNSGAQALAVTMRSIALREVRGTHFFRLASKELLVGMTNGLAVAVVTGAGVYLWSKKLALAGVIAVAMVISMAAAGLAGASIPLVLKSLNQDPAQSSSIILTTVTDVVGFLSFLGLAAIMVNSLI